jgi:anti-sigma B factor antagonist
VEFDLHVLAPDDGSNGLAVIGELDICTAPRLRECLLEVLASNPDRLVLDLGQMVFLDSTGISVLISGLERARSQSTTMVLKDVQPKIMRLFEMTALTKLFDFE